MENWLTSITISNDFQQINAIYKRFKNTIFNEICKKDQQSLDIFENEIISSIKSFLCVEDNENQEDNLIRALIATRVLSKYSIMNQEECVNFFAKIGEHIPTSIPKILFFYKCFAKMCKKKSNYIWADYLLQFLQKILTIPRDSLIYIDFLLQYAPDFVSQNSSTIILHLIQIARQCPYTFDLNHDILSKTNQTIDQYFTNSNNFYANNSIELLSKMFQKVKSIHYQTIKIDQILNGEKDQKFKSLEILSSFLQFCGNSFLEKNYDVIKKFLIVNEDDEQMRYLISRNFIFCLKVDDSFYEILINYLFTFNEKEMNPTIICGKLRNLKLLISLKQGKNKQEQIVEFATKFISNDNEEIRNDAFDLLNTICLYGDEKSINSLTLNSKIKEITFSEIHFQFIELAKLIYSENKTSFIEKLAECIERSPLETLLFLNNNKIIETKEKVDDDDDDENFIIENLKNDKFENLNDDIINPIFELLNNQDCRIRSLVPLVLVKLITTSFFTDEYLPEFFNRLGDDPSNLVKLAIIQSFSYSFNHKIDVNYNAFKRLLNNSFENLFNLLFSNNNNNNNNDDDDDDDDDDENVRKEFINFLCVSSELNMPIINEKLKQFFAENLNENIGPIIPQNIVNNIIYLPCITNAFPNIYESEFESKFYNQIFNVLQSNQIQSKTLFQKKFYEKIFCSYSSILTIILRNKPELIDSHVDDLIDFCIECLHNGVTELETQNVLALLERLLYRIGFEKTKKINEKKLFDKQTNLYKIVFTSGSRFSSSLINELVYKILGFIGTQNLYEKEGFINIKPSWRVELKYRISDLSVNKEDPSKKIYYSICSELLYKILGDQSMSHIHFSALEALIDIQKSFISVEIQDEFELAFDIFNKMVDNSSNDIKSKFVPLLKSFALYDSKTIEKYIPKLIECLINLWEFGSSSIFPTFVDSFDTKLLPYIDNIFDLILNMENPTKLLLLVYKKYAKDLKHDIVKVTIDMVNKGKFVALIVLIKLIPVIGELDKYVQLITDTCLKTISNSEQTDTSFKNSVKVLKTLEDVSKKSVKSDTEFKKCLPLITNAIPSFPTELINNNDDDESIKDEPKLSVITTKDNEDFNEVYFLNLFEAIKNIKENDDDSFIYVKKWLDELINYCIRKSPEPIIRRVFPVVKSSQSLSLSVINIAFFTCIYKFKSKCIISTSSIKSNTGEKDFPFDPKIKIVSESFIRLLMMKKLPPQLRTIVLNLIEFQDRASMPIIILKDLQILDVPISTIFAGNPALALRFTLIKYNKFHNTEHMKQNAVSDLEQAFLNNGFYDQYQNIVDSNNNKNTNDNDNKNYLLPINANTVENIHHLQTANHFFESNNWNNFDNEIELSSRNIFKHLFKAASLIKKYWLINKNDSNITNDSIYNYTNHFTHENDENFESKLEILKEIESGFESLGNESKTSFSQPKATINQSISYSQELIELQEMFFSNGCLNNFMERSLNSDQLTSLMCPILLLRIAAKDKNKDSLAEKIGLLSICRKSMNWKLMTKYYNHFFGSSSSVPVEIAYEMMYNKLANNNANESDFDSLLSDIKALKEQNVKSCLGNGYEYSTLEKFVKYQKALYYSHSFNDLSKFKEVILLCNDFDNSEAINLWSWANLKLFEIENEIDYFKYIEPKPSKYEYKGYKIIKAKKKPDFSTPLNKNNLLHSNKKGKIDYFYLLEAIKGYIKGLIKKGPMINEKMIVPNIISIISLMFNHFYRNECFNEVKNLLIQIPLHYYLETVPLIISYIHQMQNDEFSNFILDLLFDLMKNYPRAVIYDLSFSISCDQRRIKDDQIVSSPVELVKQRIIQNSVDYKKFFDQTEELTKNMYKLSYDIVLILNSFFLYVVSFISSDMEKHREKEEILGFINDLEYMNDEYFIHFCKYMREESDNSDDRFEPNPYETAKFDLMYDSDKNKVIYELDKKVEKIISSYIQLAHDRIKYDFLSHQLIEYERNVHKVGLYIERGRNCITPPINDIKSLTTSEQSAENYNNKILAPYDDITNDSNNEDQINNQIDFVDSSSSVEIARTVSEQSTKSTNSMTFILNDDNNEEDEDDEDKIERPKKQVIRQSIDEIKKLRNVDEIKKSRSKTYNNKYETLKAKVAKYKERIDENEKIVEKTYKKFKEVREYLRKFRMIPNYELLIEKENPKLYNMTNLVLPMFGTFHHYNDSSILISKFENEFTEFPSAAKPKKVNIIGSDGQKYSYILKSADDLRIDQRTMILFRFMNQFLDTKIRTYSVVPLTVQFGVIQFVHNSESIEKLIVNYRIKNGIDVRAEANVLVNKYLVKKNIGSYDTMKPTTKNLCFKKVLRDTQVREIDLRESMYYLAPDTETWAKYTVNFSKSCAVNSMVGYIIGIGDRHLQNILVNKIDGSVIHIDLTDCFEANQIRKKFPEKVPFRLTRNMVKMLGPLECNGTFRSTCEKTLELIRENRELIFNLLEVFYISPIQINSTVRDMRRNMYDVNANSIKNEFIMKRIKMKLDGTDNSFIYDNTVKNVPKTKSATVSDQVNSLIEFATNTYNLSNNFTGWCPWI